MDWQGLTVSLPWLTMEGAPFATPAGLVQIPSPATEEGGEGADTAQGRESSLSLTYLLF